MFFKLMMFKEYLKYFSPLYESKARLFASLKRMQLSNSMLWKTWILKHWSFVIFLGFLFYMFIVSYWIITFERSFGSAAHYDEHF